MLTPVGTGENADLFVSDGVDETVREAAQQSTPHPRLDLWILLGIPLDGGIEGAQEFCSEAGAADIVPLGYLTNLLFGLRSVDDPTDHAPKRA